MFRGEFVVFLATVSYVCSKEEPIITRATNDLIQFPKCDGKSADEFECSSNSDSQRVGDLKTCQCKCNPGYLAYRDPKIEFRDTRFQPVLDGHAGCVWYTYYTEGCHNLHLADTISLEIQDTNHTFPYPTILNLTSSNQIILIVQDAFADIGCFKVDPFVRIPGENWWKPVDDINFELRRQAEKYVLKWTLSNTSPDISYAYQGLIMKLNFTQCFLSRARVDNCIMTKVAGTYTAAPPVTITRNTKQIPKQKTTSPTKATRKPVVKSKEVATFTLTSTEVPLVTRESSEQISVPTKDQSSNTNSSTISTSTALFIFLPLLLLALIIIIILLVRKNRKSDKKKPSREDSKRQIERPMENQHNNISFTEVDGYTDLHHNREPENIYQSLGMYENPDEPYVVANHINYINEPGRTPPPVPGRHFRGFSYVIPPPSHDYDTPDNR